MTERNKFEEMLERLVNEDRSGAEELFHEIVVEKSRDIYETLLSEDEEVEETTDEDLDESDDEDLDESDDEDLDESDDEDLDESDDEDLDESFFDEMGPTDDAEGDMTMDIEMPADDDMDMGGDDDMGMGDEEEELEDRVMDLEDELESLKAEFEAMMGDEEAPADDEASDDMPMDMDSEEGDDEEETEEAFAFEAEDEDEDEKVDESKKSQTEIMREYTDKVTASMGDNGANAKSTVAGKNDMGGTTANIAKGNTEAGVEANKGNLKGSALSDQNPKDMNTKNVNVPGAKGATKMSNQPGHGAEKKGKPEQAADKKSMLGK